MDVLAWLWWLVASGLSVVWSVFWFLISGWVSTLLQIALLVSAVYYFKYGHGYKSGGYNIGIFTVLSFSPWTAAEHVDSFEIGAKHTFGHQFTVDAAAFWYNYSDLQIPISQIQTAGGLAQSETSFYNVPKSISRGIEFETTWTPGLTYASSGPTPVATYGSS